MKDAAPSFESTPEFQHFTDVMKRVIAGANARKGVPRQKETERAPKKLDNGVK
jgi:hypothetical protein